MPNMSLRPTYPISSLDSHPSLPIAQLLLASQLPPLGGMGWPKLSRAIAHLPLTTASKALCTLQSNLGPSVSLELFGSPPEDCCSFPKPTHPVLPL